MEQKDNLKEEEKRQGVLYIVSTPIGNDDDMSSRALKVLKNCDLIICEEEKPAVKILRKNNISKDVASLNEHNENDKSETYIKMLDEGKKLALISDCGTPVFADPGLKLVQKAIRRNIQIVVVPGASSIMTAIVRSGFPIDTFLFAGFLSRNNDERYKQMKNLSNEPRTVILLEAPYRILPILETAVDIMPNRRAYIGCNLTMHFETNHYGTFKELFDKFRNLKFKGEFVIVFDGNYFHDKSPNAYNEKSKQKKPELKLRKFFPGNRDRDRNRDKSRDKNSGRDRKPYSGRDGSYGRYSSRDRDRRR